MLLTVNGKVRAGTDPELRFTPGGVAVCSVRAVASRNKRQDDGTWTTIHEMWFTVTGWRALAEQMAETIVKGQEFNLLGEIFEEEYDTREGGKAKAIKVEALAVSAVPPRDQPTQPTAPAAADPWATSAPSSDEPPF